MTKEQLDDVRFALTRTDLRDIYDKNGIIMTQATLQEMGGMVQ